jgi:hypothetical protein
MEGMSGLAFSASIGIWPALHGEVFDTRVRLSAMAIGTQIGLALAGFSPALAAAVQGYTEPHITTGPYYILASRTLATTCSRRRS